MDEKTYNHEFKLSNYFGKESLTEEEILNILESDYGICREFYRNGIITSKKYNFITKVTFSEYGKNCMEIKKDNECTLYNMNRFNCNTIQDKLEEIFA